MSSARRDLIKSAESSRPPKVPAKYLSGLKGEERAKRKRELERRARDAAHQALAQAHTRDMHRLGRKALGGAKL